MSNVSGKKFEEMSDMFSAFTFANMQAFDQIADIAKKHGIDIDDIQSYVKESVRNIVGNNTISRAIGDGSLVIKECPECGENMSLESVNHHPGAMVPGGWKSVFSCRRMMECGHQVFNRESPGVVIKNILKRSGVIKKHGITGRRPHGMPK